MKNLTEQQIQQKLARWRLILGQDTQKQFSDMNEFTLSEQQFIMDEALASIYGGRAGEALSAKGAGNTVSSPKLSKWLGDIRSLFDKDIVTVIQNDAIERKGLKQLLMEPEILENLEPDINMATTMLLLKDQIPQRSKASARIYIKKIVEQINAMLANDMQRAVTAALNKHSHSPLPLASAIDFKYTISKNLKNYNADLKTIIPERVYFFDRANKTNHWTVILDIDQSGSMGESILYSSVMACILASMNAIKTRIVAFDTSVIDLTEKTDDPVDLLFGIQMGGGTDINKSVAYCQQFIETPSKTLFFLISDLDEGGNQASLLKKLEYMKQSGVIVISLLAIADGGKPYYSASMAQKIAKLEIPCFACVPERLPELLAAALKGHDLSSFDKKN